MGATAASYANHKNVTHHANKAVPTQSFRLAVNPATETPEQRPNSARTAVRGRGSCSGKCGEKNTRLEKARAPEVAAAQNSAAATLLLNLDPAA